MSGGGSVRQVDRISEASWRGGEKEHKDQQHKGTKEWTHLMLARCVYFAQGKLTSPLTLDQPTSPPEPPSFGREGDVEGQSLTLYDTLL